MGAPLRHPPLLPSALGLDVDRRGIDEALDLPARVLGDLPLAPRLVLALEGRPDAASIPVEVEIALDGTAPTDHEPAREEPREPPRSVPVTDDRVVFDRDEWAALVTATEADRLGARDFRAICARKRERPGWRLGPEEALGGAQPDPRERWSTRRVLRRLGATAAAVSLPGWRAAVANLTFA